MAREGLATAETREMLSNSHPMTQILFRISALLKTQTTACSPYSPAMSC